ncbi:MAG TPA: nickel pincer cofactor biosynthesis protein LarC [Vicinamibacterales bacterium]|nr:nickel pincer cofactor biosynthesis protein LarC [Vicinamibacterales bacterium]
MILYLDCFAGISGDMLLGALLDAGLPLDEVRRAIGSLGLEEGLTLETERVMRAGIAATKFRVRLPGAPAGTRDHVHRQDHGHEHAHRGHHHDHDHHHHHHHHHHLRGGHEDRLSSGPVPPAAAPAHGGHRTLSEIERLIDRSALSPAGRARARALVRRLAEVEAGIHGIDLDAVHLHEVGALDSIVDIVGAVFALEWFGADEIVASPLNVGSGTVACAHGIFPVPAPATARLLAGVPVYSSGVEAELVTPTGALLVTDATRRFGPLPPMRIDRIGYGAGDRDLGPFPNLLRVFIGEPAAEGAGALERVVSIVCEIDDMNPQIFGPLMDRLLAEGALDVFYAPVQMKKNRPGTLVTVLAPPDRRRRLTEVLFRETTTLGVRWSEVWRERLEREIVRVPTPLGDIGVKVARLGGRIVNAVPEFDDCARIAAERGLPVKEVHARALAAFLERGGDR